MAARSRITPFPQTPATGSARGDSSTIYDCTLRHNIGNGIRVTNSCQVIGKLWTRNGNGTTNPASIHVLGSNNRMDGSLWVGNLAAGGNGIKVEAGRSAGR